MARTCRAEPRARPAARPEALPSDGELRKTLARQEELARWVQELGEPYRRTLLLRWLEGHEVERIAAGEGVPVATVRTRLRRGEALLRERAERETRGAGQKWLAALAGDLSLMSLPSVAVPPVAASSTTTFLVLVAMQAKLVVALVLLALCGWLAFRPPARSDLSGPIGALPADATLAVTADLDAPPADGAATATRAEAATTAAAAAPEPSTEPLANALVPGRDLAVRVVDVNGAPVVGATVVIRTGDGSAPRDTSLRAQTSAPYGEVRFLNLAVEVERNWGDRESIALALELVGESTVGAALDIDALPEEPIILVAPPHGRLEVRFVDAEGAFALAVTRLQGASDEFAARLRVELQAPNAQRHEVQHLSGRFVARVPRDGTPVDVGAVIMRTAPVVLTGRIVDADGAPVEGAYISVYDKLNQREDPEDFTWSFASVEYAYSDAAGHVVVQGDLPVGEYAARAHGEGWIDRGAQRFQFGVRGLEFVLDRAHFVRGRVRLPEGTRFEDLEVELRREGASREWLAYAAWCTGLAADGSFLLADVRPDVVSCARPDVVPRLRRRGAPATE